MRSIDVLVGEIAARHAELDATAAEAERLGTAPEALVDTMRSLRVPMVKVPAELGGDQLSFPDQQRYFDALAFANPTAGWCGFNHAGSAGMCAASLGEAGIEAVFGGGSIPFLAAVSAPSGTFRLVEGGLELTGRYRYASGVRHAEWILLPAIEAPTRSGADRPSVRVSVVAAHQARLEGEWDVMALQGTGSVDAVVDSVFVPDHLTYDPLVGPRRGGARYTVGYQAYVAGENLGFTLGVCRRFMDELARYAARTSRGNDGRLADRGAFRYEFAKGRLRLDAARAHGLSVLADADRRCSAAGGLTAAEEEGVVAMLAHATESAVGVVTHLFNFAGAGALFNQNVLQRCLRDAQGSAQHHVASNVVYDRYGGRLLGDPNA